MASIGNGQTVYFRVMTGIQKQIAEIYPSIQSALADTDPKLSHELYQADLTLLGTLEFQLVPVGGFVIPPPPNPRQAVTMVLIAGSPVNK